MKIDIWSDIVCPFCSLGKRHLELALERFAHADEVELVWHAYELEPDNVRVPEEPLVDLIAHRHGMTPEQSQASQEQVARAAAAVGLDFNWRQASFGNTFDAHRLVHLGADHGLGTATTDRLMRAYFSEGARIGDPNELRRLALEVGLPADEVDDVLAGDRYADAVRADEAAAHASGIQGVPFFVLDGRYALSGAQPVEAFEQALAQAYAAGAPSGDASACEV